MHFSFFSVLYLQGVKYAFEWHQRKSDFPKITSLIPIFGRRNGGNTSNDVFKSGHL